MHIINSVCTTLVFPESRKSLSAFRAMAEYLRAKKVSCIEFYHDGDGGDRLGSVLCNTGLDAVYIAVIPSKERQLHLCDCNEENRRAAVALFRHCIDEAQRNGISRVMINSGKMQPDVQQGLSALAHSVEELFEYAARKNYHSFSLTLEPCDSHMDACQLLGPCARVMEFVTDMHRRGLPLELTLDTAHTVEEGEDFWTAIQMAKPYCRHIHFANCNIQEPESPFYGDKHLGYEYPNTVWTPDALETLVHKLQTLYRPDESLQVGIEVLCRKKDPYAYFDTMWRSLSFIHGV